MLQRGHGLGDVAEKQCIGPVESGAPGDHHIVARPERSLLEIRRESSLEAPPDTVTGNGVTDLFRDGEAETRALDGARDHVRPFAHFNKKCRRR